MASHRSKQVLVLKRMDMTILVVGSINMDMVTRSSRLPVPGETLLGDDFATVPGGKGANQAVAVARLGVRVQLVGRVGADGFGSELLASLRASDVGTEAVLVDRTVRSGVAAIAVDDRGENQIIVVPGANGRINGNDVERTISLLTNATALMLQCEIPLSIVQRVAQATHERGIPVILDPAPVPSYFPDDLYPLIDIITPNETEATQLVGFPVNTPETAARAATILRQRGAKAIVIKLGSQGAFCATADDTFHVPSFPVTVVDTVAAGDAFNGALAVALTKGLSLQQAVRWGTAAGALSTTCAGAQPSLPDWGMFEAFLREQGEKETLVI